MMHKKQTVERKIFDEVKNNVKTIKFSHEVFSHLITEKEVEEIIDIWDDPEEAFYAGIYQDMDGDLSMIWITTFLDTLRPKIELLKEEKADDLESFDEGYRLDIFTSINEKLSKYYIPQVEGETIIPYSISFDVTK